MTAGAPDRAVVSANFARVAFPGMPIEGIPGQRIAAGGRQLEIIGVVGDVALDVYGAPTMVVYHAHRQFARNRNWALTQVVATDGSPEELLSGRTSRGGCDWIPNSWSIGRRRWRRSSVAARAGNVSPSC